MNSVDIFLIFLTQRDVFWMYKMLADTSLLACDASIAFHPKYCQIVISTTVISTTLHSWVEITMLWWKLHLTMQVPFTDPKHCPCSPIHSSHGLPTHSA